MMSDTIRRHISSEQRININTFNCVDFISPDLNKVQKYNKNSPKITWRAWTGWRVFCDICLCLLESSSFGRSKPESKTLRKLTYWEKSMLLLFFS